MRTFATFPDIIVYATPSHIVYNKFAHTSLVGRVAIEADGVVIAPLHPYKVFSVTHILSIQWCAVRVHRKALPIRRSVRTVRWSTPRDVGRSAMCVARKEFGQSYVIKTMLSLPTEVRVLVVPPPPFISIR